MVGCQKKSLDVLEFNGRNVRFCRSVCIRARRVVTDCFSFPLKGDAAALSQSIRQQWKVRGLKPKNIILVLPRTHAISKLFRLPSCDPEEIKNMVSLYMARETAAGVHKQIVYDFDIVGFDEQDYALVNVFSISHERLAAHLDIFKKLNLYPKRITLNTQGFLNWSLYQDIASEDRLSGIFLLNMDERTFDFNVIFNKHVVFSRNFVRQEEDGAAFGVWLSKEVKVSMELFKRMCGAYFPCGDTLYVSGFSRHIQPHEIPLDKAVRILDTSNISMRSEVKRHLEKEEVSYASVLGLAMKEGGFDMTPPEIKSYFKKKKKESLLWKISLVAHVTLFVVCGFLYQSINFKSTLMKFVSEELRAMSPWEKELEEVQENFYLDRKITKISLGQELFSELYQATSSTIYLSDLVFDPGRDLVIQGKAENYAAVFNYLQELKKQPLFKKALLVYAQEHNKNDPSISFKVTCDVR